MLLQAGPSIYSESNLSSNGELIQPCRLFNGQAIGEFDYGNSGEGYGDWNANQNLHRDETTMESTTTGSTCQLTFTPTTPIAHNTSVEINVWDRGSVYTSTIKYSVNGGPEITIPYSSQSNRNGYQWVTVATGAGTLDTLKVTIDRNPAKLYISAIRVDGKLLNSIDDLSLIHI